jgi:uncharacterized membrane protein YfcA
MSWLNPLHSLSGFLVGLLVGLTGVGGGSLMTPVDTTTLLYPMSGFIVGILVGTTGVGGGSLMTPLLILLFGIHPATAVGTDLLYAAATKTVGTAVHGFGKTVDWRLVGRLSLGSVPMTILTGIALHWFNVSGGNGSKLISVVLGFALLATALLLIGRTWLLRWLESFLPPDGPRHAAGLTVLTGAALGVLVTLSSVGAGALGVTALILLYPRMPAARIVGSDIAHAVPLTLVAGLGHWWLGSLDWPLLTSLLSGSIPGIILGSYLATKVPDSVLRPLLAGVLVVVGSRLVF